METNTLDTELSIMTRLVSPELTFPPDVARAILSLSFPQQDIDRMNELADTAQECSLTGQECIEVESYRRVGHWLSIMKSKARRSLAVGDVERWPRSMKPSIRREVWRRANWECEYCQMPETDDELPFHLDHIVPKRHRGTDDLENLACACFTCSTFKGYNISGFDQHTGDLVPLFNPRLDQWSEHFSWMAPN